MKRKLGLTACYLFALVFPPLCGLLLQRLRADWTVYYRTSSFVGYEAAALAAMLLCGGCMVLHTALSGRGGGRPWPQILACAALRRAGAERKRPWRGLAFPGAAHVVF